MTVPSAVGFSKLRWVQNRRTSMLAYRITLWLVFGGSALAGPLRRLQVGPVSGTGIFTLALALLSLVLVAASPSLVPLAARCFRPLTLFTVWMFASFSWGGGSWVGSQNALVFLIFAVLLLISARYAEVLPTLPWRVARLLQITTLVTVFMYGLSVVLWGLGNDVIWHARTFAMFSLLGLAWFLSAWRYGRRSGLWISIGITVVIAFSLSRMAFAVALLLFLVAQVLGNGWRRFIQAGIGLALCAGLLTTALQVVGPLKTRFTERVGSNDPDDANAYASGRIALWAATLQSALESPWVGKGAGSAGELVEEEFPGLGHPLNDYVRLFHDYGTIGLVLFVLTLLHLVRSCWRVWRCVRMEDSIRARLTLATLLALLSGALMMLTDNTLVYIFLMAPLGVLLGVTLSASTPPTRSASLAACHGPR